MSKIHTTLHKKGDSSVEIYPNIESENIPSDAITTAKIIDSAVTSSKLANASVTTSKIDSNAVTSGKLAASSVTTDKINDGAVTTSKIQNESVTTSKINDGAVTYAKIDDNAIGYNKLGASLKNIYNSLRTTYLVYAGNSFDINFVLIGTTTIQTLDTYTTTELNNALDFDKPTASEFTSIDLDILALLINGFIYNKRTYGVLKPYYITIEDNFNISLDSNNGDNYEINMSLNGSNVYKLNFTLSTHTITTYTYDGSNYPYISISQLVQA